MQNNQEGTLIQPLTDLSRSELKKGSRQALKDYPTHAYRPGDFQEEFNRRTNFWFTLAIAGLTLVLVALGAIQIWVTVQVASTQTAVAAPKTTTPATPTPPAFAAGPGSYYCVTGPGTEPCTIIDIFRSIGGAGTETFTMSATYVKDNKSQTMTCQTVVPSTPKGDSVEASCVVEYPLPAMTTLDARPAG